MILDATDETSEKRCPRCGESFLARVMKTESEVLRREDVEGFVTMKHCAECVTEMDEVVVDFVDPPDAAREKRDGDE